MILLCHQCVEQKCNLRPEGLSLMSIKMAEAVSPRNSEDDTFLADFQIPDENFNTPVFSNSSSI